MQSRNNRENAIRGPSVDQGSGQNRPSLMQKVDAIINTQMIFANKYVDLLDRQTTVVDDLKNKVDGLLWEVHSLNERMNGFLLDSNERRSKKAAERAEWAEDCSKYAGWGPILNTPNEGDVTFVEGEALNALGLELTTFDK